MERQIQAAEKQKQLLRHKATGEQTKYFIRTGFALKNHQLALLVTGKTQHLSARLALGSSKVNS